ncbi:MAG: hypothetical protein HZA24_10095 [Nitrospirae bacterium]|nr:hypothetical protein [Nitrospirota bacterium]
MRTNGLGHWPAGLRAALLAALLAGCGGSGGGTVLQAAGALCGGLVSIPKPQAGDSLAKAGFKWERLAPAGAPPPVLAGGAAYEPRPQSKALRAVGGASACANLNITGNADGQPFTMGGTVTYEDRLYNANGFTGARPSKPVRGATVEVVRCIDGVTLATGATGQNGAFSVTATNPASSPAGVYVRVLADAAVADAYHARVTDHQSVLYAVAHSAVDERTGGSFLTQNLHATEALGVGGAFNILDVTQTGLEYVDAGLGIAAPGLTDLTLVWSEGITAETVFNPTTHTITLVSSAFDTDDYDDMVIMHEVGHFIADQVSQDDSPGGMHILGDTTQDARLSWSEGWGNFFASAGNDRTTYVDTDGTSGWLISFDLETRRITGTTATIGTGATNELGVAATLWDALDSPLSDGSEDQSDLGPGPVLGALADLKGITQSVDFGRYVGKLRAYMQNAQEMANFAQAASLQGIAVAVDAGDPDLPGNGTLAGARPITTPLPGASRVVNANLAFDATGASKDEDLFQVTLSAGVSYSMCTFNLADGADTAIDLLSAGGTVVAANDNYNGQTYSAGCGGAFACPANDTTTLASSVTVVPGADASYYVRVKRAAGAPPSAGLFGAYSLMIAATP